MQDAVNPSLCGQLLKDEAQRLKLIDISLDARNFQCRLRQLTAH
jgi:hypothetical protein